MTGIMWYRLFILVAGLVAFGSGIVMLVLSHQLRRYSTHDLRPMLTALYSMEGTLAVSMWWRVSDWGNGIPMNKGDFTVLVPVLGFLLAFTLGIRVLGRVRGRSDLARQVHDTRT